MLLDRRMAWRALIFKSDRVEEQLDIFIERATMGLERNLVLRKFLGSKMMTPTKAPNNSEEKS